MKADAHTGKDVAKYLGVSRATPYRYLTEDTAPYVGDAGDGKHAGVTPSTV
jgi:hypothetical protein